MSDPEPQDTERDNDGIKSEDLGYGAGAKPQHAGGLGATLPGNDITPTGTGAEVTDATDDATLSTLPEGSGTPSTRNTATTSGGDPDPAA